MVKNLSSNKLFVFADMTTAQIEAENTQMTNDLYRLLKKYTGLRNLIRELKVTFTIYVIIIPFMRIIKDFSLHK